MLSFIKKKIKKKIRKLFFYAFSEMDEGREYPLLKDRMVKTFPELALLTTDARSVITDYLIRSHAGKHTKFYSPYHISDAEIGDYTYVAPNAHISMATIGKFCSIGPNLICGWGIHPLEGISTHPMFFSTLKQNGMTLSQEDKCVERQAITIGHDVLIGANVTILDGVTIGNGAVIGAGAVVSKDIPPYAVAVGCPIKIIRYRFDEETRQKMEMSQWWDRNEEGLKEIERNIFNVKEILR